jgi:hypothetical protein
MVLFFVNPRTFSTESQAHCYGWELVADSLDLQKSSVTVDANSVTARDVGKWAVADGTLFVVDQLRPKSYTTTVFLKPAVDFFSRPIPFAAPPDGATVGSFLAEALRANWTNCPDPEYATPYLAVSDFDTTPFTPPAVDAGGFWRIPEYVRSVRSSLGVDLTFTIFSGGLRAIIARSDPSSRVILLNDGNHQLQSADLATSAVAKITAVQGGIATDWYLSSDGVVSQAEPFQRASGAWNVISVTESADVAAKVAEAFAKALPGGNKIEFYTDRDYKVLDRCSIRIGSDVIQSVISMKRKSRGDSRWFYRVGSLATTATEKLKGVI